MAKRQVEENDSTDGVSDISRVMFLDELASAKQRAGTAANLAARLGIRERQLYRWCNGIGPSHNTMVALYDKIRQI